MTIMSQGWEEGIENTLFYVTWITYQMVCYLKLTLDYFKIYMVNSRATTIKIF